ncbi:hypothetical protein N7E02_14475 [Aliirhizobium terrae]|uniref:hypothetical protein n=1 Tax=Terrirhizobium terrae TaxID=2926709 RepID=UPI0025778628|nr:hypothetical protein [Rhizobium sp. CC-CFT758]WJH41546.1 hypothetical protein N7E02_14475 [Rhizobium sp. CC-CFT758]
MSDAAPEPEVPYDSVSNDALDRINELLRDHWGLSGQVFPVGDEDGTAFLVDNGHLRYLLEVRPPQDEAELRLQHEAMRHIIRDPDGPAVPEPVATKDGEDIVTAPIDGQAKLLRLLTALEGDAPPISGPLSPQASAALGSLVAGLEKAWKISMPPAPAATARTICARQARKRCRFSPRCTTRRHAT